MKTLRSILSDVLSDVALTQVRIAEIERLGTRFTRIRLCGDKMSKATWTPGDKLQLRTAPGTMTMRTYTPVAWNPSQASCDVIAYHHDGDGPGSRWFGSASAGERCEMFGPSRSIDLTMLGSSVVFLGDETSVALAVALRELNANAHLVFETSDRARLTAVLSGLGVDTERCIHVLDVGDCPPLLERVRQLVVARTDPADIVVSGNAQTVSALRRAARSWGPTRLHIHARAYWAAGRTGLS